MSSPKINPLRVAALLRALRGGNYFRHAAPASGIHYTTAYDWLKRGDNLIAEAAETRPGIEAELADWLLTFEDNFDDLNAMWSAPPPTPFSAEDWPYVLLAIGKRKAEAQAVADSITEIRKAGKEDWRAHAWWLERAHASEFGRQQTIQHTGPDGGPVEVASVTPDELMARVRELREQGKA